MKCTETALSGVLLLEPQVFEVNASGADPLTLEELRRAGPLGGPSL